MTVDFDEWERERVRELEETGKELGHGGAHRGWHLSAALDRANRRIAELEQVAMDLGYEYCASNCEFDVHTERCRRLLPIVTGKSHEEWDREAMSAVDEEAGCPK